MLFARHTSMNIALSNPTDMSARVRSLVQVKAYHDHLLNYQKELEERAARRTRELSQTLEDLGRANDGLKREAIPLPARITAVADVFDALSSNRPYKRAFTLEQSVGIITDGRGLHFDPRLVDAFMAVRDEVFAIRHNLEDTGQSIIVRLHKDSGCNAADP
jgi:hypothetical protein